MPELTQTGMVDAWNAKFPRGTMVKTEDGLTKTTSRAWLGMGRALVRTEAGGQRPVPLHKLKPARGDGSFPGDVGFQIRFDGPPGPVAGCFIDVEDLAGKGIKFGEWREDGDHWLLVFPEVER